MHGSKQNTRRILSGLYGITDPSWMPGPQLLTKAEAALTGGCRILQYRNKTADPERRLDEARQLRALCTRHQAALVINDDVALACAVEADGVHIGQGDGSIQSVRRQLGAARLLGVTCHGDLALARTAQQAGADYVAFGCFFDSHSKPHATRADVSVLQQAADVLSIPRVAIGGITRDNATQLIHSGADMVAVSHDLFGCDDVENRAREFSRLFL